MKVQTALNFSTACLPHQFISKSLSEAKGTKHKIKKKKKERVDILFNESVCYEILKSGRGKQQRKFSFPPSKLIYFLAKYIVSTPRLKENHLRYKKLSWEVIKAVTHKLNVPTTLLIKENHKMHPLIRPCKQKPNPLQNGWIEIKEALIENQRLTQTILQLKQNLSLSTHKGNISTVLSFFN